AQAGAAAEDAPPALVTVIGASVSSGFVDFITGTGTAERNQTVPLWNALQPLWGKDVRVRSRSVMQMFEDPLRYGRLQVARAAKDDPALVVAVDFLFWFGYGYVGFEKAADGVRV